MASYGITRAHISVSLEIKIHDSSRMIACPLRGYGIVLAIGDFMWNYIIKGKQRNQTRFKHWEYQQLHIIGQYMFVHVVCEYTDE